MRQARRAGTVTAADRGPRRSVGAGRRVWPPALLAVLVAGGCADLGGNWLGSGATEAAPRAAPAPSDPLAAFAAQAQPGTEATVVDPATGQTIRARLVRAYTAASGRECREVMLLGAAGVVRGPQRLLCRGEGEAWAEARPLLRSGGTARP